MENLNTNTTPSQAPTPVPQPTPEPEQEPLKIADMKNKPSLPVIIAGVVLAILIIGGVIFAINYLKPKPYVSTIDEKPSVFEPLVESPVTTESSQDL